MGCFLNKYKVFFFVNIIKVDMCIFIDIIVIKYICKSTIIIHRSWKFISDFKPTIISFMSRGKRFNRAFMN